MVSNTRNPVANNSKGGTVGGSARTSGESGVVMMSCNIWLRGFTGKTCSNKLLTTHSTALAAYQGILHILLVHLLRTQAAYDSVHNFRLQYVLLSSVLLHHATATFVPHSGFISLFSSRAFNVLPTGAGHLRSRSLRQTQHTVTTRVTPSHCISCQPHQPIINHISMFDSLTV